MATKTLITESEYLRMTFDGPEAEFVDGEVVERSMPNTQHSDVQSVFCALMYPWRTGSRLFAFPELRVLIGPGQYRVVDIAVFRNRKPVDPIPSETPFITVEILSPDDKFGDLMTKLDEYKAMGVPQVWVIDPGFRRLKVFDGADLRSVAAFELPEFGLCFTPAQIFEG